MGNCENEIELLDVHTMWQHEAHDFTPWLAENLHMLGDAIGLKLELVQTEAWIGPNRLDILAKTADSGTIVAIENQLEVTDLHHLGQLLTYTTGFEAQIAVWVAPFFSNEHAQALHRLNEWTRDSVRFYGVKVEVINQADGTPAPLFSKVVWPGGWNKEATLPPGEIDPEKVKYNEFFGPLVANLLREGFAEKAVQYFGHTGRRFPSRLNSEIGYAACLGEDGAWVLLSIRTGEKELTNLIFDTLETDRVEIEQSIDAGAAPDWHWLRFDNHAFSSICIRRDGFIDDPAEKLDEVRAWMLDLLPKLREVFNPRLANILDSS
jgi:hypothetical protein